MKKKTGIRRVIAVLLALAMLLMPQTMFAENGAAELTEKEISGKISARYIKAIIDKIAEDYRFNADKQAMYEAVLDYVMSVDPTLLEGSISAATGTLDKYSEYFTREELEAFVYSVDQVYVGIGVTIQQIERGIEVVEVNPRGGAYEAGVQVRDIIFEVDGVNVVGKSTEEVSSMVRGEEGTTVNLKVYRGETEVMLTVERRLVGAETISYSIEEGNVGYIYISTFATSTVESMKKALAEFKNRNVTKMIIDVRDNPGGELSSVIKVLSMFVPKGKTLTKVEYNDGRRNKEYKSQATFTLKPKRDIIVLANENSASAAEMFAGCLQNLKLAKVVGVQTFGKGSMQEMMLLNSPPGMPLGDIKLSVAEFTKPDGGKINGVGIEPDIRVKNIKEPYDASGLTPMTYSAKYTVGDEAQDVLAIEERLNVLGFYTGKVDGIFDNFTKKATEEFQAYMELFVYGVMDFTTQNALNNEVTNAEVEVDRQYETAYEMMLKE